MKKPAFFQRPAIRVGLFFVVVIFAFIIVQQLSIPKSYGAYGSYRGDNVQEWVSMSPQFSASGSLTCSTCHGDKIALKDLGPHTTVGCESCHLAAGKHILATSEVKPVKDSTKEACLSCHAKQAARPETIGQIDESQHNFGMQCINCHDPHSPWAKMGGKKP